MNCYTKEGSITNIRYLLQSVLEQIVNITVLTPAGTFDVEKETKEEIIQKIIVLSEKETVELKNGSTFLFSIMENKVFPSISAATYLLYFALMHDLDLVGDTGSFIYKNFPESRFTSILGASECKLITDFAKNNTIELIDNGVVLSQLCY